MTTEDVQISQQAPRTAATVHGHAAVTEIAAFLGAAYGDVVQVLAAQHRQPAGPPFARYRPVADGFEIEAGFPADGPVEPVGRVAVSELPGGLVASALYRGGYAGVGETYDAIGRWLPEHGYAVDGDPWESYLDGPEVPEPRTLVSFPARTV